jgi:tetratricopeptide (TPR) repeat protein
MKKSKILFILFVVLVSFGFAFAQGGDGRVKKNTNFPSKQVAKEKIARKGKTLPTVGNNNQVKINRKVKNFDYYVQIGRELMNEGELQKAIENFNHAIQLNPKNFLGYFYRARTYALAEIYDEAISDATKAINLSPSEPRLWNTRGIIYRWMEKWNESLEDINRAIRLSPTKGYVYASRAETYKEMKKYEDALNDYNKAVSLSPKIVMGDVIYADYYSALNGRAELFYLLKQYDKALIDLKEPIEDEVFDTEAYCIRALVYEAQGKKELAKADRDKCEENEAEMETEEQ